MCYKLVGGSRHHEQLPCLTASVYVAVHGVHTAANLHAWFAYAFGLLTDF
jgi:hypothetical protein